MKLTTPDNLPYPGPGDDLNPLDEWIADLAIAVQKAVRRDTGWRALPLASTVVADSAEPAQYRILNGVVYLRGRINTKTGNFAPGGGVYATLPSTAAPADFRMVFVLYQGLATGCRLIVATNGTLAFNHNGQTTAQVRLDGVFWPLPA